MRTTCIATSSKMESIALGQIIKKYAMTAIASARCVYETSKDSALSTWIIVDQLLGQTRATLNILSPKLRIRG